MAEGDLGARLERFLASRMSGADAVRVAHLERNTEGFSQETFSFDVEVTRGGAVERRGYVAKLTDDDSPRKTPRLWPQRTRRRLATKDTEKIGHEGPSCSLWLRLRDLRASSRLEAKRL